MNFGSVFQAYALAHFLDINGYDTEIIDYRPGYYKLGRNKLKTAVGRALNYGSYSNRKQKFENFISKYENRLETTNTTKTAGGMRCPAQTVRCLRMTTINRAPAEYFCRRAVLRVFHI